MKAMILVLSPEECAKLMNGDLSILVRKKFSKDYVGWVYVYCTKGKTTFEKTLARYHDAKVVARFWCDKVEEISFYQHKTFFNDGYEEKPTVVWQDYHTKSYACGLLEEPSCLSFEELHNYLQDKGGYAIHITKLEIFDKPKEISEFYHLGASEYHKDIEDEYGRRAKIYKDCFFGIKKAPQSWCYIEV